MSVVSHILLPMENETTNHVEEPPGASAPPATIVEPGKHPIRAALEAALAEERAVRTKQSEIAQKQREETAPPPDLHLDPAISRSANRTMFALFGVGIALILAGGKTGAAWLVQLGELPFIVLWLLVMLGGAVLLIGRPAHKPAASGRFRRWIAQPLAWSAVCLVGFVGLGALGLKLLGRPILPSGMSESLAGHPFIAAIWIVAGVFFGLAIMLPIALAGIVTYRIKRMSTAARAVAVARTAQKLRRVSERRLAWVSAFAGDYGLLIFASWAGLFLLIWTAGSSLFEYALN
ncbi:hypothetical protein HMPREF9336_00793 [Segniliparus rugosus ATCC BAA-974]|uniref:Uncharacterized protein n=2 Tax=Segniliparus rugosus TaxID=286804 RepID=E5XMS3_SEGRC|nr:hypothetical protein HMPREF9336_00793 [Segniliparus rugosus ATCC BAA-974]